ncbi:MAG: GAF domain-containing protein [Chloroflexota bacterium]
MPAQKKPPPATPGRQDNLSNLNQVTRALCDAPDLQTLFDVLQAQLERLLPGGNLYIALYHLDHRQVWYPRAVQSGARQDWPRRPLGDWLADRVIRSGESLLLAPIGAELAQVDPPLQGAAITAWVGQPLCAQGQSMGCLALFSLEPEASYRQAELDLLAIIAVQISAALEKATLVEQTQRRATQLKTINQITALIAASLDPQEVLAQVCRSVTRIANSQRSAIFLLDAQESLVWLAHHHQLPEAFIQQNQSFTVAHNGRTRCLRTAQPLLTPELDEVVLEADFIRSLRGAAIQAFGDFPMVTPEGQIGFLTAYYDAPHDFTPEEVELLQTLASQAALAVSNARLHARTDLALSQRAHQLAILEAVGRELSAAATSERLFAMVLSYAVEFTNSPWGLLGLLHPDSQTIEVKASHGFVETVPFYSANRGISGRALRTRQVIYAGEARQDPDFFDLTGGQSRSHLSIPLRYKARVLGVLTLEKAEPNGYSANDQSFVSQLANQAAIAVINADLYRSVQQRLSEQSMLYQLSARLASTLALEDVLQTIQDSLCAYRADVHFAIYLWEASQRAYLLRATNAGFARQPSGAAEGQSEPAPAPIHLPGAIALEQLQHLPGELLDPQPFHLPVEELFAQRLLPGFPTRQVLIFPLVANQQRLGLVVLHFAGPAGLQPNDLQLLQAVIGQGVISLQNALLFADVAHGRDRLAALLNTVQEGILMIESDGRITLANEALQVLTGLAPGELLGRRFASLGTPVLAQLGFTPEGVAQLLGSLEEDQVLAEIENPLEITTGSPQRFLERSALPVRGQRQHAPAPAVIGWMIVLRDITHEHEIAAARQIITETVWHDLRSPLSTVLGAINLMEQDIQSSAGRGEPGPSLLIREGLHIAQRGTRRVLDLAESLLDVSRMQSGSIELARGPLDLHTLAEHVVRDYGAQANEFGVQLRSEVPDSLPKADADGGKISRVLTNLVDNALKFTPAGGLVLLSATPQTDGMLAVRVSDSGPGIPENYRDKIFERFAQVPEQRGRRRGTGLGLTFCRLAVEAHGGRIWVEERPGGGSVFTFTLPAL